MAAFALFLAAAVPAQARPSAACFVARPPNSLWSLARCCERDLLSDSNCRYYSKKDAFIILKDNSPAKPEAYLIIPTAKVTGIEDPKIFAPPIPDFWAYGWRQAQILLKKPAADTAMAINSKDARTQNQLHIHISCVRLDVARALADSKPKIGSDPVRAARIALGPQRNVYRVVRVTSLLAKSPFELAAAMSGGRRDMAAQSIAVVGAVVPGTYYVLDTYRHGDNPGNAEELLEEACRS